MTDESLPDPECECGHVASSHDDEGCCEDSGELCVCPVTEADVVRRALKRARNLVGNVCDALDADWGGEL